MAHNKTFELQFTDFKISLVGMPTCAAVEEDTSLVECAENISVPIPAALKTDLSQ